LITLKDIAVKAGVSIETVSRVLNGKNKEVWPSAVRRADAIRRIAKKAGFRPNFAAKTMRKGRFNQIACVVTRFEAGEGGRDLDRGYLEAATVALAEHGYSAIFEPFVLDWRTMDILGSPKLFSELAVDGILGISEAGVNLRHIDAKFAHLGSPAVWINRDVVPGVPCVVADELANAKKITRYFITQGHRRIGYVGYQVGPYSVRERNQGVREALEEAGLDTSHVVIKNLTDTVPTMIRAYFDEHRDMTAIVGYSGQFYDSITHEMMLRGIRLHHDLDVGYFGMPSGAVMEFPVVILEIPKQRMATEAVKILIQRIEGEAIGAAVKPIPGDLYVGGVGGPVRVEDVVK